MRLALVVALALSLIPVAHADPDHARVDEARARTHFESGRALYLTGNYDEAMREFALGFELAEKPEFILNIGLCHYRLGHLTQARENYLRYLRAMPAGHPRRKYAEERLAEVERDLAAAPEHAPSPEPSDGRAPASEPTAGVPTATAKAPAATGTPTSAAPPSATPTAAPPPSAPTTLTTAPSGPPRRSWMRRNWWVIPVVTVAAAGVAVGLGLGLTRNNPCAGAGACVAVPAQ